MLISSILCCLTKDGGDGGQKTVVKKMMTILGYLIYFIRMAIFCLVMFFLMTFFILLFLFRPLNPHNSAFGSAILSWFGRRILGIEIEYRGLCYLEKAEAARDKGGPEWPMIM